MLINDTIALVIVRLLFTWWCPLPTVGGCPVGFREATRQTRGPDLVHLADDLQSCSYLTLHHPRFTQRKKTNGYENRA